MSDQPEQKLQEGDKKSDHKLDKPPDASKVRNATGQDKQVALGANPNAKSHSLGHYISETPEFRAAYKQDIKGISAEKLQELQLDYPTLEEARDEVFSDMYAHACGLQSNNPRSRQMKELFPNSLEYAKTRVL